MPKNLTTSSARGFDQKNREVQETRLDLHRGSTATAAHGVAAFPGKKGNENLSESCIQIGMPRETFFTW
ncbi:MAG: hypothetical protein AAF664_02285 [Planctomycetota bacterium]